MEKKEEKAEKFNQIVYGNEYNKEHYAPTTIIFKKEVKEKLRRWAKEFGVSLSAFVNLAVEEKAGREGFLSLEGKEKKMATREEMAKEVRRKVLESNKVVYLETEEEYFYIIGQILGLFKRLKGGGGSINYFLNAETDEKLKKRVINLYKKVNGSISFENERIKKALAMMIGYNVGEPIKIKQDVLLFGFSDTNFLG